MTSVKITDLTAYTDAASTDVLPIVDVGADVTKKIAIGDIVKAVPQGTAALPGLAFDGDPNSGVYSPGADQVAISTNGTGRLFVDASGNFGINEFSPLFPLVVRSPGTCVQQFKRATTVLGFIGEADQIITGGLTTDLAVKADGNLVFGAGSLSERMRLDSSGRLGLGTSSPGAPLHVSGSGNLVRLGDGTNTFDVRFQGPNNWDLQLDTSADKFNIRRNSSSLVTVDGAGRVGIGTTAPSHVLDVSGGNIRLASDNSALIFRNSYQSITTDSAGNDLTYRTYQSHIWKNVTSTGSISDGSERMRIDSSGRLLVGTSSARTYSTGGSGGNQKLQVETAGATSVFTTAGIYSNSDVAGIGAYLELGRSKGTSLGSVTAVANDDLLGEIRFAGTNGSASNNAATIAGYVDGTVSGGGANDMPGRLVFSTTADGASSPTERMRISSNGIIQATSRYDVTGGFGASANPGNGNAQFTSYTAYGATILGQGSSYDISFLNKSGSFAGYVATGATTITTSSDERLKENFQPIENALEIVATMRHETGNYKSDPDRQVAFLVAQDVDQHWPYAVEKSNPDSWGVNYNWIIPLHGAAIAELKSIIETQQQLIASLETRLSALEGA